MNASRAIITDLLRAALVLALVALSFAHAAPAGSAVPGSSAQWSVAAAADLCGDGPAGGGGAHAPCHACRIWAGVDLPPATAIACRFDVVPVRFAVQSETGAAPIRGLLPKSRAPPVLS